jgi:hypothetical protein
MPATRWDPVAPTITLTKPRKSGPYGAVVALQNGETASSRCVRPR